jgi:hypothetical protein
LRLVEFYWAEADHSNSCGLGVEFKHQEQMGVGLGPEQRIRNAVVMSKYGKRHTPRETAIALRLLADWCDGLEGDFGC